MKVFIFWVTLFSIFSFGFLVNGQSLKKELEPLSFFLGEWDGSGKAPEGPSALTRNYELVMDGNFIRMENSALFNPAKKGDNPPHEDFGVFSYDKTRNKIVFRQFLSEGFVNQYTVDIRDSGKTIIMETESIENLGAGFKARYEIKILGPNSFSEDFYLSSPGKESKCLIKNKFERMESE